MPRLHAKHRTEIAYAGAAAESVNEAHLTPLEDGRQSVEWARVGVHPAAVGDRGMEGLADAEYRDRFAEFLIASAHVRWPRPVTAVLGRMVLPDGGPVHAWLVALEAEVNRLVAYTPGATMVDTPIEDVVRDRRGVCQDMAHLMIALCRSAGVAARYVSGWLHLPGHEGPAESHAWMEAVIPGAGWREFDPTHPRPGFENHVRVAVGRDYADVAPLRGSYSGAPTEAMRVSVEMDEVS